ncbi:MAG: hypothetical protein ACP5OG_05085 [Candidatus Nanoarchaeia archaeon]
MTKKKVTLSIDDKIYGDFQKYCENNAIMLSKKIELVMKELIKGKAKSLTIFFLLSLMFLIQFVNAAQIHSEDFESGIVGWSLSNNNGVNWLGSSLDPYSGTSHAQCNAPGSTEPASTMEKTFSTQGYQNISVKYYRKLVGLDAVDWFSAEYYDGSWHELERQNAENGNYVYKEFNLSSSSSDNSAFALRFECTAGAVSEYCRLDDLQISGNLIDITPPSFSSFVSSPENNSAYVQNRAYFFNVSLTENNIARVWIEFNGINYTSGNITNISNIYSFNITNLAAGNYNYRWWANDTNGNKNSSQTISYFISKATPTLTKLLNGNNLNLSIVYPGEVNASGNANSGTLAIYRNGVLVDNAKNYTLASGYYKFEFNVTGNQNYSNISEVLYANVTKATQTALLNINESSPIVYGNYINVSCNGDLYRNNILVNQEKSSAVLLGAGTHNYSCKLAENQNYSYDDDNSTFVVEKASGQVSLFLNNIQANNLIQYPEKVNASAYTLYGTINLYRNSNLVNSENFQNISIGAGYYNYTAVSSGDSNHTGSIITYFMNITKGTPIINLTLNNLENNLTITYLNNVNAKANSTGGIVNLYRDNILINSENNQNKILAAGYYEYKANASENENYTASEEKIFYLTINKRNPSGGMIITLDPSGNEYYGVSTTATASETNPGDNDLTYKFYINNTLKSSVFPWQDSPSPVLNSGVYLYKFNTTGGQNYTSGEFNITLSINKLNNPVFLLLNNLANNLSITFGETINASANSVSSALNLYRNQIDVTLAENNKNILLGAGNYTYFVNSSETLNYLKNSSGIEFFVSINKAPTMLNFSINNIQNNLSLNFGEPINASAYNNFGTLNLYRDNTLINSENNQNKILAAGNYEYKANITGNENYTDNLGYSFYVEIIKANSYIELLLNGSENNISINNEKEIEINASRIIGEKNISIYINEILVYTGENNYSLKNTFEIGSYNVTLIYQESANYSSSSSTLFIEVTDAPDIHIPNIEVHSPGESSVYGYNDSIQLNYIANDENLESCWYSINNQENFSLVNCQNTTFGVSQNGNYTLMLYANDTFGNLGFKQINFSVIVGAPSINLHSPSSGSYLNNSLVSFEYTPEDIDLDSCELWINFELNQTQTNPLNNQKNYFYINLSDSNYFWNIKCNDSQGNEAFNGDKGFIVDTTSPNITLYEPTGTKTSKSQIPLEFNINDISPLLCFYSLTRFDGANWVLYRNNTSINCSTSIFDVADEGTYNIYLNARDFAGNNAGSNLSFIIDETPQQYNPPSSGGSSGGGSGGTSFSSNITSSKLEVSRLGEMIARPEDKKTLSLNVKNTGRSFLNNCKLIVKGNVTSWIYSRQITGISPGENVKFVFDMNVPQNTPSGKYLGELSIKCDEETNTQNISIDIPSIFQLIKINQVKQDNEILEINYNYNTSSETNSVDIWLINPDNQEVERIKDEFAGRGTISRSIKMQIKPNLVGIYYIYIAPSKELSNYVRQSIVLGKSSTTGEAVLGTTNEKGIFYIIFLIVIGIAVMFIIRSSYKASKTKIKIKKHKSSQEYNFY